MNNGPFFRNYSNQHPIRSMPIHHQTQPKPSPKIISVPVHFVSSHQSPTPPLPTSNASSAAIKIQTLFRGFLVRKSLKKIASIRTDVTEIERRIDEDIEAADLIRRDAKERLRVNETLMSLLFKLDSIRGFDFGFRELRKAVTKKAIALQEKIDSIANPNQTLDNKDSPKIEPDNNACTTSTSSSEQVTETSGCSSDEVVDDSRDLKAVNDLSEDRKEDPSMEDGGRREVMVKVMGDNYEKMMKVMMEISERNEMQTRMINALSRRVEQLEKAFVTKRKKKTRAAASRKRDCIDAWFSNA